MDEIITVSDLAGYPLNLRWMSGDEMLGGNLAGMFEYRMELESPVDGIEAKDVIGKKLTINLQLPNDAGLRYFNGHVTSWSYRGKRHDNAIYRATIHPWLWFLNFTTDCRIFNKKSAIDIVKLIFRKYNSSLFAESLLSSYPTHEFLVQYRESDLNLVCRLLQEEGAYFFFRHEAERHTLVLADGISAHEESSSCAIVPYIPPTTNARELRSHFESWKAAQDIQVQSYQVHDYDYEKARVDLLAVRNADPEQERVAIGEIFDYPARYCEQSRGETIATLRLEELHEASQSIEAAGNPWGLGAGHIVTVPNPPESDKPIKYLVTSAHYELRMAEERSGGAGGDEPPYAATYSLLPTTEQFRPRRVNTKPVIVGPQTAVVVGEKKNADPELEEIVTDAYRSHPRPLPLGTDRTQGIPRAAAQGRRRGRGQYLLDSSRPTVGGCSLGRDLFAARGTGSGRGFPRRRSRSPAHHRKRLQRRQHAALQAARQQDPVGHQEPQQQGWQPTRTSTKSASRTSRARKSCTSRPRRTCRRT